MNSQDWKAMLGAAFNVDPNAAPEETTQEVATATAAEQQGKTMIDIILDKKGRNGKKATIVANLTLDEDNIKDLAAQLKRYCGVGGSARGGEILIQGDKREAVLNYLKNQGFKARII
ncbi:MAG: translation initiation factor [Muribaculaceae bacterium]|nr:translation initiation factor [Muribaculaceae bacterium]